jgi:hypothetical protein
MTDVYYVELNHPSLLINFSFLPSYLTMSDEAQLAGNK